MKWARPASLIGRWIVSRHMFEIVRGHLLPFNTGFALFINLFLKLRSGVVVQRAVELQHT
jgi:hypothetical protein